MSKLYNEIVILSDGRKGKCVGQLVSGDYLLASGKGGQISYFTSADISQDNQFFMVDRNGNVICKGDAVNVTIPGDSPYKAKFLRADKELAMINLNQKSYSFPALKKYVSLSEDTEAHP